MKKTSLYEPINCFLHSNIKRKPVSFHMPGHKYGRFGYRRTFREFKQFDITEIPGADNLRNPGGIILKSQMLVAGIYGADLTIYLTNGSTSGILAVMGYAKTTGRKLLVSRDAHISAVNGSILFNVRTGYIPVEYKNGIPLPVSPADVETQIAANPDAGGVLITSPNYYGMAADIKRIAEITHRNGMFLAVDEAHGAHMGFSGLGSLSGIQNGADIVCHSLHKTMPVFNQGALIHVCGTLVDAAKLTSIVNMITTTSPSYPIVASMEKAISFYNRKSNALYGKLLRKILSFKKSIKDFSGASIVENDDFSRIVIDVTQTGKSGFEILAMLHDERSIDMEMADFAHIVGIATPSNKIKDFKKLAGALKDIGGGTAKEFEFRIPGMPGKTMEPAEAISRAVEIVPLDMAGGRICGTIIMSYPPGIPLVCPGEVIDGDAIEFIKRIISLGGTVLGIRENGIPVLEQT
ncbi:MAG: aminotransferase class I/II-fold pyridoxal phosphate-dependent enzyme [Clostridia bacterium]|nr:aminotransferase class I/II-fold pyridoxal phosphate-dependent enzyme [Clostridia bacterium]